MKTLLAALVFSTIVLSAPESARLHHHPLYGMLIGIDAQIAALRATIGMPGLSNVGATATAAAVEADRDLAGTAAGERRAAADGAGDRNRELAALALLAGGTTGGAEHFQTALRTSESAALAAYARALDARVARGYERRAAQFAEAESTLAFELERRDAGATLPLRVKLADLHPDAAARVALRRRLDAILAREDGELAALQTKDRADLAAYRGALVASARSDYARESERAAARIARSERARSGVASLARGTPPPVEWQVYAAPDAQRLADAAGGFEAERAPIAAQARDAIRVDAESTRDTLREIAALVDERNALLAEIVHQIRQPARAFRSK